MQNQRILQIPFVWDISKIHGNNLVKDNQSHWNSSTWPWRRAIRIINALTSICDLVPSRRASKMLSPESHKENTCSDPQSSLKNDLTWESQEELLQWPQFMTLPPLEKPHKWPHLRVARRILAVTSVYDLTSVRTASEMTSPESHKKNSCSDLSLWP